MVSVFDFGLGGVGFSFSLSYFIVFLGKILNFYKIFLFRYIYGIGKIINKI